MLESYKFLVIFLGMYVLWIPLGMLASYISYKNRLSEVPKNFKNTFKKGAEINATRDRKRKHLKTELKDCLIISLIPALNIVLTFSAFNKLNK